MNRQDAQTAAPSCEFDDASPWGTHRLKGIAAGWLRGCHAIPAIPGGRRLAMWARHPLKHRLHGPVDARIWGWRLRLMPRGNLSESRWLFLPRFVDRAERLFWQRHLPGDAVFLDVGANAGMYSFWIARCLGSPARILAIEPDPQLQRRLTFNRQQNDLTQLELLPLALGESTGTARLVTGSNNLGENRMSSASANPEEETTAEPIPVRTLLGICEQHRLQRIDGLKIDIEGREHEVMAPFFANAPATLYPRWLQFERCTDAQASAMEALMTEVGYHRVAIGRMNAIYARGRPDRQTRGATP